MKMDMRRCCIEYQRLINTILLFVVVMIFLLGFADNGLFPTDEEEIFIKGMAIAKGQYLYKDIVSQHMPLMYYFAAFFSALGVHSIVGFRISFYVLMAVIWAVIQFRYGKIFSYKVVWIYAISYIAISAYIACGTTVLSEQIQQFGVVILLLEFLIFVDKRQINLCNAFFISLAIVLCFGAAFVSVFPIAVVFFSVAIFVGKTLKVEDKVFRKRLLKDCIKLIVIILLPWIIYLAYLVYTNTWEDFFYWNYSFNREIYAGYLAEVGQAGYGQSVIGTYLLGIKNWISIWLFKTNLFAILNLSTLLGVFVILFVVQKVKSGKGYLGICILMYVIACSTRGVWEFHGLPCIAVECTIMALYLKELIRDRTIKQLLQELNGYKIVSGLVISLTVLANMCSQMGDIINKTPINQLSDENSAASIVSKLTDEGEVVGFAGCNYDILVEANRIMANKNPASPWIWDACKEEILDTLIQEKPRVIIYQEALSVWGYYLNEFAIELDAYIDAEYTRMDVIQQNDIYVRNDYYEEAIEILDIPILLFDKSEKGIGVTNLLNDGDEIRIKYDISDCEITGYAIKFGTYQKDQITDFNYEIVSLNDNEVIQKGIIQGESILDNEYREVEFKNPILCERGQEYELKLTVSGETGEEISIYTNQGNEQIECYINNDYIDNDIDVLFYGRYVN